jgi:phosphatidylglycerophosphate synthase
MAFKGDVKFGRSLLHAPEEGLKACLLPWVPRRVETYHLTLMTVLWSALIPFFSLLARARIAWLWAVSLMIVLQYLTDLLDGAIGRQRNTGLVKWGYYMDHFLDFAFLCAILIGYAILLPQQYRTELFFIMAMFAGYMVNSFLSFACTNKFQIAYMGIGPTEIRIVFIVVNTLLICCGRTHLVNALPYVLAFSTFGLFVTVYRTGRELWRIDMRNKSDPPPAS